MVTNKHQPARSRRKKIKSEAVERDPYELGSTALGGAPTRAALPPEQTSRASSDGWGEGPHVARGMVSRVSHAPLLRQELSAANADSSVERPLKKNVHMPMSAYASGKFLHENTERPTASKVDIRIVSHCCQSQCLAA